MKTQSICSAIPIPELRIWASIIDVADFLGCDSLGQHMVKALEGTATIVTGSTYRKYFPFQMIPSLILLM